MKTLKVMPLAGACLMIGLGSAEVGGRTWRPGSSRVGSYDVQLVVEGTVRQVDDLGGTSYLEGQVGERYAVRVHNRSFRRVEAVISVDGRDVIDGRPFSLSKRGYVIPPYSFIDIEGFRLNLDEVAAFRFASVPDSYAARMGTPWTVGAIEVAIFPERVYRPIPWTGPPFIQERKGGAQASEQQPDQAYDHLVEAPTRSRNLGTQFGERRASPVAETGFVRESWSHPAARLLIRYDDRGGLCNIGIGTFCYHPHPSWPPPYEPEPPPREFAAPPPGWEHFSPWY